MNAIRKTRFFQILLFIILCLSMSNCVSDDYNLKNGVNTDISLGGDSLSFPLGKSKPILLSSMLNGDSIDILKKATDGSYSLEIKDSTQMKVKGVNPVTFSIVPDVIPPISSVFLGTDTPPSAVQQQKTIQYSTQFILLNKPSFTEKIIARNNLTSKTSKAAVNTFYFNIPNQTFNININQFVSKDVKKIFSFTLKTPSQLVFKIDISKLHPGIDSMHFYNYTIQLPSFIKFNDPEVNSNNQLIINSVFKVTQGYTKTLKFNVLDFNSEGGITLNNGTFILNRVTSMHGDAFIRVSNLTPSDIGVFEIQPSIAIGDMQVSLIEGEIKPVIDPIIKKVTLNLPDIFKQSGNTLDIQNPVITLLIGNSMGFTVDAGLNLIPKSNGTAIPNGSVSTQFSIPSAAILGQSSWSNFWMSKSNTGIAPGYQPLIVPALPNLLKIAPDEIELNVTPVISGSRQNVDLYSPKNQLDIKYTVKVPLDFGKDFSIQYLDTLRDLKKNLEQVIKMTKHVEMVAFVDNKIPLVLNFEAVPLNTSGQTIPGISILIPETIKACNSDGSSQRSTINMSITETVAGALSQLDAVKVKIFASKNTSVAGILLNANQSMTIEMRVKVPKGLTITQN